VHTALWWGNLREVDYLEDLGVGGRIYIKTDLKEIDWYRVHWGDVDLDTDKWRAVVNVAMNLEVQ
jgi:hypothetical protein